MIVDVTQVLKGFDDVPLLDRPGAICEECGHTGKATVLTLRIACIDALTTPDPPERDGRPARALKGVKHLERFDLALRIKREDNPDLNTQDAAEIQRLVAMKYATVVAAQVWKLLDGKDVFPVNGKEEIEGG